MVDWHRLALYLVLGLGMAALVFNALSLMGGHPGLLGLPA